MAALPALLSCGLSANGAPAYGREDAVTSPHAAQEGQKLAGLARQAPSIGTPGKIILSHRYKGSGEEQNTTGGVARRGAPEGRDRVVDGARRHAQELRQLQATGARQPASVGRL